MMPTSALYPSRYHLLIGVVLVSLVAAIAALPLGFPFFAEIMGERGPIETWSFLGYIVCAVIVVTLGGVRFAARHLNLLILLIFLASRELDFDKRFTTMGIFKTRFYVSPDVPIFEKVAAVAVILILGWAVIKFLVEHRRQYLTALVRLNASALAVGLALVCMVISKTFDGSARKLLGLGIEISPQLSSFLVYTEELLEAGISMFFIVAALAYFSRQRMQEVADRPSARL